MHRLRILRHLHLLVPVVEILLSLDALLGLLYVQNSINRLLLLGLVSDDVGIFSDFVFAVVIGIVHVLLLLRQLLNRVRWVHQICGGSVELS